MVASAMAAATTASRRNMVFPSYETRQHLTARPWLVERRMRARGPVPAAATSSAAGAIIDPTRRRLLESNDALRHTN